MNSNTSSPNTEHELSAVDVANDGQKQSPEASKASSYGTVDTEFKPLTPIFEPLINVAFCKLGSELQQLWNLKISPYVHWDNASFYGRLKRVEIFDNCNDPQKEKKRTEDRDAYARAFDVYAEIAEVEIEAQKIEQMNPLDLAQDAHKKSERRRFKQEIDRLMQKLESKSEQQALQVMAPGDTAPIKSAGNSEQEVALPEAQATRQCDSAESAKIESKSVSQTERLSSSRVLQSQCYQLDPEPTQDEADEIAAVIAVRQNWRVVRPQRFSPYAPALYQFLCAERKKGRLRKPTAMDVLEAWRITKPPEIYEVMQDELKYLKNNNEVKTVSLRALQEAISRMTEVHD